MSETDISSLEENDRCRWEESGANRPDLDAPTRPFYNLMMFPYPSAQGLHVGNLYAFTGADCYGRFKRLQGHEVFQPIGFDAFGIHSENYALEQNRHPKEVIPENIENFRQQLKRVGIMYDWNHTVDTTTPEYYQWTQWLFTQLFEEGLVEQREAPVNWCPGCQTVLANEQAEGGVCERCDSSVEQKNLKQWFLKITEYAEQLLENLDWIDWSETTKTAQRQWIGKSEGARITWPLEEHEGEIETFTTRPETLYGATFLVLAPEHPRLQELAVPEQQQEIDRFVEEVQQQGLVERRKARDSTQGVFTGAYAQHPLTGESVPIWTSDYVLGEYGTGAIMAVPAHDERDFSFARKHELEIKQVVDSTQENGVDLPFLSSEKARVIQSGDWSGLSVEEAREQALDDLEQSKRGEPETNYQLHDWCISRQRYWGPPIPIVQCDDCGAVPVPEEDLPVRLPDMEDVRPQSEGAAPLDEAPDFVKCHCPECGQPARRETEVSDTFLDSAWYFLRYPSTDCQQAAFDPKRTETWLPVDMYIGGEEHAVLHLLYSRFVTMALQDMGHVDFEEPYDKFRKHGLLTRDGAKISKSRGNVIVPDRYLDEYGVDVFRGYLMFSGPFQEGGDFSDEGIAGIQRWLQRLERSVRETVRAQPTPPTEKQQRLLHQTIKKVEEDFEALSYNTAIAQMMECHNELTAEGRTPTREELDKIVIMMAPITPHIAERLWRRLGHEQSLFAGDGEHMIVEDVWPEYSPERLQGETIELPIQINGRHRTTLDVPREASEEEVLEIVSQEEELQPYLADQKIERSIYLPGQILNLVLQERPPQNESRSR